MVRDYLATLRAKSARCARSPLGFQKVPFRGICPRSWARQLMPLWAATTLFFLRSFETRRLRDAALAGLFAAAAAWTGSSGSDRPAPCRVFPFTCALGHHGRWRAGTRTAPDLARRE